jgi:hypothetical protein
MGNRNAEFGYRILLRLTAVMPDSASIHLHVITVRLGKHLHFSCQYFTMAQSLFSSDTTMGD